jgi:TrmH RNA methyltransferase
MHGGVVALVQPKPVPVLDPTQAEAKAEQWARERKLLLLLDGIGNPHNLGAIVRTAAFFGVPRIVLSDHPAQALPSDASYRVAEGGLEFVELYRAPRFAQLLARLRKNHRVVAASADGGQPLVALPKSDKPFALILGNEQRGLTRTTLEACDAIVTIPGAGQVQSLNVAASAAILIHALAQR